MTIERNPQAKQLLHPSMVRTLKHQIASVWPEEETLFARCRLPAEEPSILDVGCGIGEASVRLAHCYPSSTVVGVDVLPGIRQLHRLSTLPLRPDFGSSLATGST